MRRRFLRGPCSHSAASMEPRRALAAAHSWDSKPRFAEVPGVRTALPLPPCSLPRRLRVPLVISPPLCVGRPGSPAPGQPRRGRSPSPRPPPGSRGFLPKVWTGFYRLVFAPCKTGRYGPPAVGVLRDSASLPPRRRMPGPGLRHRAGAASRSSAADRPPGGVLSMGPSPPAWRSLSATRGILPGT